MGKRVKLRKLVTLCLLSLGLAGCDDPVVATVSESRFVPGTGPLNILNALAEACYASEKNSATKLDSFVRKNGLQDKIVSVGSALQRSPREACHCYIDGLATDMSDFDLRIINHAALHVIGLKTSTNKKADFIKFVSNLDARDPMPGQRLQLTQSQLEGRVQETREKIAALQTRCKRS